MPRSRIFEDQTILAGGLVVGQGPWIKLYDAYTVHAINGNFAGQGLLRIYGQLSSEESEDYVEDDTDFILNMAYGDNAKYPGQFHRPIKILANEYIRFYAQEVGGLYSITALNMRFILKARGA